MVMDPSFVGLFPGQGSQHVGMAKSLFDNFSAVKLLFEEASDAASVDMKRLLFDGAESDLALTANTQPALVLASLSAWTALEEVRPTPFACAAGHSLGEYSALVAAKSLSFSEAIRAVRNRGMAMQEAVPVGRGAMLAILGLSDEDAAKLCEWTQTSSGFRPLEPANFNAPGQVVVSGSAQAVEWLKANWDPSKAGVTGRGKLIPLNVSAPFHCSMMKPAQDRMRPLLESIEIRSAEFFVIQNVNAKPVQDANLLRRGLIDQITASVLWTKSIQQILTMHPRATFLEIGPGKVLSGLVKKIDSSGARIFNMGSLEDIRKWESEAH